MAATVKKRTESHGGRSSAIFPETLLTIVLCTLSFLMLLGMALDSVTFESDSKSASRSIAARETSLPFINVKESKTPPHSSVIQAERELFVWPSSQDTQFVGSGDVFLDDENHLQLEGGKLQAVEVETDLLGSCRCSNELSIELTVVPADTNGEACQNIVAFRSKETHNFLLGQAGDQFVFQLKTTANTAPLEIRFGKIDPHKRHHLLISYRAGTLTCFLNGKGVLKTSAFKGKLENWQPGQLVLGGEHNNTDGWYGSLELLSIHGRTIDRTEAFDRYDLAMVQ